MKMRTTANITPEAAIAVRVRLWRRLLQASASGVMRPRSSNVGDVFPVLDRELLNSVFRVSGQPVSRRLHTVGGFLERLPDQPAEGFGGIPLGASCQDIIIREKNPSEVRDRCRVADLGESQDGRIDGLKFLAILLDRAADHRSKFPDNKLNRIPELPAAAKLTEKEGPSLACGVVAVSEETPAPVPDLRAPLRQFAIRFDELVVVRVLGGPELLANRH
jgi:hypothetical protein